MSETIETAVRWNRIDADDLEAELPDVDTEVMIYDAELNDTVLGHYDDEELTGWRDSATDELLPQPTWWADKPYPED